MKKEKTFLQSLSAILIAIITIGLFRGLGGWKD